MGADSRRSPESGTVGRGRIPGSAWAGAAIPVGSGRRRRGGGLQAVEDPLRRDELLDRLPVLRDAGAEDLATVLRDEDDVLDADPDAGLGVVDARLDGDDDARLEGLREGADVVDLHADVVPGAVRHERAHVVGLEDL